MNIYPRRISSAKPEGSVQLGCTHPDPVQPSRTRPRPTTPPLQPQSGTEGWSPLDVARQHLENAHVRVTELEASLDGMRRTLLRKEQEVDQLRKQIEGTALPTPPTSNAISALREAKKKKRNRR
jgi:hypothetical protein